jgi:MSHA biogenesis protein MshG
MATFKFEARDSRGERIEGELEATNLELAAEQLIRRQLVPIRVTLMPTSSQFNWKMELWPRKVSLMELIIFSRQMYSLMKAGIPIIRAIRGLAESTSSVTLQNVLLDLAKQLESGRNLSTAMASYPKVFSKLVVSIVHVGENTGRLDDAFDQLSYYFEQELETRKQIKQATRYPIIVMIVLVVAMVVMNLLVIPQFANMFARYHAELPWSTKLLLATSGFFQKYWPLMVLAIIAASFSLHRFLRTTPGQLWWSERKLRLPIVGDIINRATLGRYARSFSLMLRSGVPLTTALSLVADAVDNEFMGEKIREMRRNIERGESLVRVSAQSAMFTPLVMQMLAVGEETGKMDDMLREVAVFYEREVEFDLKNLTAKIEPILISVVAVMVLILALGIFTPMWDLLSAYKNGK